MEISLFLQHKNDSFLKTYLLLFGLLLLSLTVFCQDFYKLRGYVYSQSNEPVVGAAIRFVNGNTGTISDQQGKYEIKLLEGLNRISVSAMGYQTEVFEVVADKDVAKNIFLKIDQKQLEEVVIKIKKRDYSYEVIKKVIENKAAILNQYQNYKAKVYIKSIEKIESKIVKKKDEDLPPDPEDALKTAIIPKSKKDSIPNLNIFECQLVRHQSNTGQQKEEREAVKKIGDQGTLFFKSVTDGEFDLYRNHQKIAKIGDNEITSPLSDLTFLSYKFQLLKYYFEGQDKIYQIKVIPREAGNALYEGTIEILEDSWTLRSVDLKLTKRGLLRYDEFAFKQEFVNIENRWIVAKTVYNWKIKEGDTKKIGTTEVIQSGYEFDLLLPKRFFGDEVGLTTDNAYKRDSTFWQSIRPHPLTKDEQLVIKEKERLEILQNSKVYLDSVDKVYNRLTLAKIAYLGMGYINRVQKTTWFFEPIISLFDPLVIGGWRMRYGFGFYKRFENRKQISLNTNLTYGFRNQDLKGQMRLNYFYNPVKQSSINLSIGSGFNVINGAATIADIVRRDNFYQNKFVSVTHRTEYFNGFYTNVNAFYEIRSDLSDFKFSESGDRLFPNNSARLFPTSYVYKTSFGIEYTPRQLYLREPNEKIILGSKYPTFRIDLERAWPMAGQNNNVYTQLTASAKQTFNVGVFGTSEYKISGGTFLDTTRLAVMDYKYIRGGDPYIFAPAMLAYQLIPKTFPVFDWYFESHFVHQFNGYFTSKIPLLNRTKIREMVGAGLLYVPERKYQYSEVYFGLNRVFKIGRDRLRLGCYYVVAQSNDFGLRNGFKISFESYDINRNTWSF